jgi:tight adherence protein C
VAESLKVHSESLRTKRRLVAEEAAAKLPVKILMPLIFCVFPALLTVLMGPAIINVSQILLHKLAAP